MDPVTLVHPKTLQERLSHSSAHLLDVRTAAEYETAHIPGSHHLPLDQLGEHAGELGDLTGDLVLICQTGGRAKQAAQKLAAAGITRTAVLDGGLSAWIARGGTVDRGRERWALERQVRLVAGSLVLAGVAGSVVMPKLKWLAGGVGAGLTFAAISNTCMMGNLLARLPYNRGGDLPAGTDVVAALVREDAVRASA